MCSQSVALGYEAQRKRMRARLKAKARRWKLTALRATKRHRRDQQQLRRCRHRIAKLENRIRELEAITQPRLIFNHTYPVQMVALAIFMVTQAQVSLRGAAKTLGYFSKLMGWSFGAPGHVSVLRWVLRAGLYQYNTSAEHRIGQFAGIMDESISLGGEKLLIFQGVKLPGGLLDKDHALTGQDVEVLAMQVSPSWTADGVGQFLDEALDRNPDAQIDYVVTDGGQNLRKALADKGIDRVGDVTHLLMNLVKKQYKDNDLLSGLCAKIGTLRRQTLLGRYGFLAPPTLRDKDRFLRIFNILDWVTKIDKAAAFIDEVAGQRLAFIDTYRPLLKEFAQVRAFISFTAVIFKSQGLSRSSIEQWRAHLRDWMAEEHKIFEAVTIMVVALEQYLTDHQELIDKYTRLVCCSDITESTFGRYKNKGGVKAISADVLKIPLYNVDITLDFVDRALSTVTYQEVYDWETVNTCPTRYAQLRTLRESTKSATALA